MSKMLLFFFQIFIWFVRKFLLGHRMSGSPKILNRGRKMLLFIALWSALKRNREGRCGLPCSQEYRWLTPWMSSLCMGINLSIARLSASRNVQIAAKIGTTINRETATAATALFVCYTSNNVYEHELRH